MNSKTTPTFWKHFESLSPQTQHKAREAYELWRDNPAHPSLRFKRVKKNQPLYSARVDRAHRALGLLRGDTITWFWIGGHDEYDRLLR